MERRRRQRPPHIAREELHGAERTTAGARGYKGAKRVRAVSREVGHAGSRWGTSREVVVGSWRVGRVRWGRWGVDGRAGSYGSRRGENKRGERATGAYGASVSRSRSEGGGRR